MSPPRHPARGLPYAVDDDAAAQEFIGRTVNMRQPHPQVWSQLFAGERIEQTARVLTTIKQDVMARFTKRRADLEALRTAKNAGRVPPQEFRDEEASYRIWHARAVRFDQAVSQRAREAKLALRERNRQIHTIDRERSELDDWKLLLVNLVEAVHHHQEAIHPDDASDDDRLLWSRLDLVVLPGDHGGTLRDLIRKRLKRAARQEAEAVS